MTDRKIAPPVKDAIEFNLELKPYTHFTLNNGVPVYTIDAGVEDVLQIEMVFYAGNWFEEQPLVASAVNSLLKNGTSTKNAFEINEHFEYYGAFLNRSCYNETAVLSLHTLNKHLDKLLPVVTELITDATFPETELEIYQQNNRQRLLVNLQKCDFVANRLIDAYVYGEQHPYGRYTNVADVDALNTGMLKDFYKKYYANGQCVIFVSGKMPADIEIQLNKNFGTLGLSKPGYAVSPITAYPVAQKKYQVSNDPNGVQGAIRMARPFPNRHHPDFMKAMVLNNVFGGFFGSRLMSNIREEKGYTYGIYSYLQNHIQQSSWVISTEAGVDVCRATVDEVYKEMELLRNEPPDAEELLLVRNYMIGTILGELDGPFQIMGRWKNIILNGLTEKYFYDSMSTIKNVTGEELMEMAKKYLVPEDFYELVVI
jgi:predicted Zn-dependent peptidase